MPFKKNEDGSLVQDERGNPVYVGIDGAEKPFDVDAKLKQIAELVEQNTKAAHEIEELKMRLKPLEGVDDIAAFMEKAARDAESLAAMGEKERESEIGIQRRIAEATKAAQAPLEAERDALKKELAKSIESLNRAKISDAFARSKYAGEKLISTALAQQLFEGHFHVKNDRVLGRDHEGKDIYGPEGLASFDEALCRIVEASPFRDNILRATPGGSGTDNGKTHQDAGGMTPDQVGKLSPEAFMRLRKENKL